MSEHASVSLPPARRLTRRAQMRVIGICAAIVAVIALIVAFAGGKSASDAQADTGVTTGDGGFRPTPTQARQLSMVTVGMGEQAAQVQASGLIAVDADHSTPILLPFSGQITDVLVEPGDRVTRGQPLLRVASADLADARNALQTAAGQLTSATEAARLATANAARQKAIVDTAGGAYKDYQQAQADLISARATQRSAQGALAAAQGRLTLFSGGAGGAGSGGVYRSPVSGVVADRSAAPGQFVTQGSPALMTITNPATVWLVAQLPEDQASQVHLGDSVTVTTPALPGRQFAARINNIAAALDPVTRRLAVRAAVSNPDGALKPQMFAAFTIVGRGNGSGADALLVPAQAVIYEGDGARVWVAGRDGVLHARTVTVGETQDGRTRILTGLRPGERIVAGGALFVNEAGLQG